MYISRRRRRAQMDSDIDMTPMLDIVFIMLIFFIVTAVFIDEQGLDFTQAPESHIDPPTPSKTISVYVFQDGSASVNGILTEVGNVPVRVEALRADNPKASVLIRADHAASLENVVFLEDRFMSANIQTSLKIQSTH